MKSLARGPQFLAYMGPLLSALRALNGAAKPKAVKEWIAEHLQLSDSDRQETIASGQRRFDNRVHWARYYLSQDGLIAKDRRGVWRSTELGAQTYLDEDQALEVFQRVRAKLRQNDPEEDAPAPEAVESTSDVCWFVGTAWGGHDHQVQRFLAEGVWEDGDDADRDKVLTMAPGDRIAIKAAYVQRQGLPFQNNGRPVSVMSIRATGVITENLNDGRRVRVDWDPPAEPRNWYFYTYRRTVQRVLPDKPERAALIRFTFDGEAQDFDFWAPAITRYATAEAEAMTDEQLAVSADEDEVGFGGAIAAAALPPYTASSIVADGCFLPLPEIEGAIALLARKKNLILQGPPGTGKTWLAKRLGYALIGSKDPSRLMAIQFQPSLSYEDFVRGWRPDGKGGLTLANGAFLEAVAQAQSDPRPFIVVIEEVNRGNPAQIFGELLTLLEHTKRGPDEGLRLAYPRAGEPPVWLPENLYVIGTMNLADRSLALVDLALRRRFAFLNLRPELGETWKSWCVSKGAPGAVLDEIAGRVAAVNAEIAADRTLGPQFCVGHSFVTPTEALSPTPEAWRDWYAEVVRTEIAPLLEEYWYDDAKRANSQIEALGLG